MGKKKSVVHKFCKNTDDEIGIESKENIIVIEDSVSSISDNIMNGKYNIDINGSINSKDDDNSENSGTFSSKDCLEAYSIKKLRFNDKSTNEKDNIIIIDKEDEIIDTKLTNKKMEINLRNVRKNNLKIKLGNQKKSDKIEIYENEKDKNYKGSETNNGNEAEKSIVVIFEKDNLSKKFYFNGDELGEILYKRIFADGYSGKLYRNMTKVSKYLTISENGFIHGINKITLGECNEAPLKFLIKFTVKLNSDSHEDIELSMDSSAYASEILNELREKISFQNAQIVCNGRAIDPSFKIGDYLQSGDIVDIIESEKCKFKQSC